MLSVPRHRDPEASDGADLGILLIFQGIVFSKDLHGLPGVDGTAEHSAKGVELNAIIRAVHFRGVTHQRTLPVQQREREMSLFQNSHETDTDLGIRRD